MKRILVVFQFNHERTMIVGTLRMLGFLVDEMTSTLAAIRLMDEDAYDLVLAQRAFTFGETLLDLMRVGGKSVDNVLLCGPAPCPGELFAERTAVTALGAGFLPLNTDSPDVFAALVQSALVDSSFARAA